MSIIPVSWMGGMQEWIRQVANAVNPILRGYPFQQMEADPSGVDTGFTYFNTTTAKLRTWDGAAWQDHW